MGTVSVKVASAVIAGLGLTAGVVGLTSAQTTGEISNTGEDSVNDAVVDSEDNRTWTKDATVDFTNNNDQTATSGEATVEDGDDEGAATSGGADNDSTLDGAVTINQGGGSGGGGDDNGGSGATGTIDGTGEDSDNVLDVTHTDNRTYDSTANVTVTNNNPQNATSGDATVSGGNDGGTATSGPASNTSSTTLTIGVTQ